jgi:hypothetical protein
MRQVAKYYAILGKQTFSPLDLSPALWLDASDTATITASSGSVSQWDDKSGNGRNVTQGTAAAQPTTGSATLNGLNVLSFDGGDVLVGATASDWTWLHAADTTLFAVIRKTSADQTRAPILNTREENTSQDGINWQGDQNFNSNGAFVFNVNEGGAAVMLSYGTRVAQNETALLVVACKPSDATAANRAAWWKNGASSTAVANSSTATVSSSAPGLPAWVGASKLSPSNWYLTGAICEIVGYSSVLSTSDRDEVETYLMDKWGL